MDALTRLRVIHLVSVDGINTNENAMKRFFYHFTTALFDRVLVYSLLCWKCASHQTNLVVCVAICGQIISNATENNPICAAASRLYKYLIPDYCEEFASNLKRYVYDKLELVEDTAETIDHAAVDRRQNLRALYGGGCVFGRAFGIV